MRLEKSVTTFARGGGGGCFIAGTEIYTPDGVRNIEELKAGDTILSFNETSKEVQTSKIGKVDKLVASSYYIINDEVYATGEHPFYTSSGIVKVKDLRIHDEVLIDTGYCGVNTIADIKVQEEHITSIKYIEEDVVVYNLLDVEPNNNYFADGFLVHNKGGFGGGGRASASSSRSTSSRSTSTSKTTATKTTKVSTKPGSKVKTSSGKTVKSSTAKPSKPGFHNEKGIVGANGYSPRFSNGYHAPAGSVVYYHDTSFIDYLPWIYLFGHSDAAPQNQQATVVQPDGKQVQTKPVAEGTDGLAILNWIILIVIVVALIGGTIWGVNKLTNKDKKDKKDDDDTPSFGRPAYA